ncbi:MAG TPA: SRPBCC family protein [Ignavibacteria bacterium]|nr:SRPBCC family protein [Ignavibacteria bacterium]HQY51778.1 SRPBCC family protein [Ignavibacteria bacterium]HRA99359.1 SRPBCC family protein [Ignavibacteria bacterium]
MFELKREQLIHSDLKTVWTFFSSPINLSEITPPELDFRIITETEDTVYEGMEIEYRVKPVLGIPVKWISLIKDVDVPFAFTDEQLTGPYKVWIHKHEFSETNNGVLVKDHIQYQLPFGSLGTYLEKIIVRKKLTEIFNFRSKIIKNIFPESKIPEFELKNI